MSASQMLDTCVNYIARRHHMLTDEHVKILDGVWEIYQPTEYPHPLRPSPPSEPQNVHFVEHDLQQEDEQAQWRWRKLHERQQERVWQEYEQEQLIPRCSDYIRSCDADRCTYECGAACGSSPPVELPVIDLTCRKASCEYGCDCTHEPIGNAYSLPPTESCLYGCSYNCGAKQGDNCIAQFDGEGNQLPPVVQSVVDAAIDDTDDEMPPLIHIGARAVPRGWYNPEEDTEDEMEIVDVAPPQPVKTPKAKPIFPYNHPRWPSPRAKVLVQWLIRRAHTSKDAIRHTLKKPGDAPIKSLTHDICMQYLAKFYNLTHEQLMEKTIYELHNPDPRTPSWHVCLCSFCEGGW